MSHKHVSNKATFKNQGFLSKLSSTLMTRRPPPPEQLDTRSSLSWHKTSEVKERIKTATGTFAVYEDMTEEQVQAVKESAFSVPAVGEGGEALHEGEGVSSGIAEAATIAVKTVAESTSATASPTATLYIAIDDYTPDADDGLLLVSGQKVEVLQFGASDSKRARVEPDAGVQLLDNSAAKHKMAIRPKRNHPSAKSKGRATAEERWLVRDPDSGKQGTVPSHLLGVAPAVAGTAFATSIKRSLREMSTEESVEAKKKLTKEMRDIKTSKLRKSSSRVLGPSPEEEAIAKRTATIKELIETEEEFVKDLDFVMENYYSLFDKPSTPKSIRDHKKAIFGNFNFIAEFHKNVLIEGVKYHAEVPSLIGKTFLRLERDFDKHSEYCTTEPEADEFLDSNSEVKEYFENHSDKLGDDKRLHEHLKLPIQRLNDYQLLFKEIIKFSSRLGDETTQLERAHDLIQTIPQRATDAKFLASIEGFKGNLFKLGRLLRHDWFSVSEVGHKKRDRYLFLFKARILITKVKRIAEDRSIFVLKDIIRLPETSLCGLERPRTLEFHHIEHLNHPNFPIVLETRNQETRDVWLEGVKEHVIDTASVDDLLFDDEIRVVSEEGEEDAGHVSPFAEGEDLVEDLPKDHLETDQVVPYSREIEVVFEEQTSQQHKEQLLPEQEFKVPSKPFERVIEIEVEKKEPKVTSEVETSSKRSLEKEEQFDIWSGKEPSPPPKKRVLLPEQLEEIPVVEESQIIPEQEPIKPEVEPVKEPEPPIESFKPQELASKRPKEEEEESKDDFWGRRESSPPLKKRATPLVKEHSPPPVVPEVSEPKEDLNLEQVESFAFKAEEKVAEQKQELTLQSKQEKQDSKVHQTSAKDIVEERVVFLPSDITEVKSSETFSEIKSKKGIKDKKKSAQKESIIKEPIIKEPQIKEPEIKKPEIQKAEIKKIEVKTPEIKTPEIKEPEIKESKIKEPKTSKAAKKEPKKSKSDEPPTLKEDIEPFKSEQNLKQSEPSKTVDDILSKPEEIELNLSTEKFTPKEEEEKLVQEKKEQKEKLVPKTTPHKEARESTMEPSHAIVGLVEERPESQGRHAITSVASAWRAPPPRPVFTKSLSGNVVEPGEGASFICEVQHANPYYVTWLKDNKVLDDKLADRVQQQDEGHMHSLKLLNCNVEDSGIYTAKATDTGEASATCSAQLLVQELTPEERDARIAEKKPFFLVKMRDTEVIENTKLSYAVHTKGDPMPKVTFFKDSKPLKEDDRVTIRRDVDHGKYELVIGHVQMTDGGLYKCQAMNKYDQADCEAVMTVKEEKQVLQMLSGKGSLLEKGESADFKWFRDGVEFDPVERFNVMFKGEEDTLALVFQNVTPDDAGIYTCVASTSCGKISCSAELTVEGSINRLMKDPVVPVFEEELSDTHVGAAGTAMLECRVSGYPKPELTWTRNGLDVKIGGRIKQMWEDDENVTLIIKNISESDKGLYNVKAKNDLGEADSCARLIIRAVPKFRKFEKQIGCNVDQPLNFVVSVDGEPTPELKWLKDGKEIIPDDHIQFESKGDGSFSMKIDKMTHDDCGSYSVVATNDMGQRAEQFEIQADTAPEITRGLDAEIEKKAGTDLTFEVRAHGSPRPDATWFKNGKELSNDDKYRMTKDGDFYMLKLRNISRADRGTYKIILKNKNGDAGSEGNLVVRGPPEFTTPLKNACAKEGTKDVKLFVEFDANPRPALKWFFQEKAIHDDTPGFVVKSTDSTSILTIQVATPDFVGPYSIKASNEYGDRSSNAKFRLHEAPQVLEPLKDVDILEDTKCVYQCKVSGVPVPDIRWTKDGAKWTADEKRVITKKEGDEVYMLMITEAKTEDSAKYTATLTNVEGKVTTEGSILVNTPPHITGSNFKDGKTYIAMHKFVLEVQANAVPDAEATWYFNGKELKEEEDSVKFSFDGKAYKMERLGSDPDHSGEYKCKLKNKIKEVEEVGTVRVIEKESRVRQALKNVNVKEKTDGQIQCQIVGDPIPTVEWFQNGKPLRGSERIVITEDREKRMHYLTFKSIEEKDMSTFTLKGRNEHGECETSCKMGVYVVPKAGELQDTVVDFGRDLLLNINIHALPPPKMTWFKNGKPLAESERALYLRDEEAEVYSLQIKSVVLDDDATYTYTGSNEVGEASGKSVVKIHTEKPTIVSNIQSMDMCLEDEVSFTVKCAGLPPADVEWRNKNVIVNSAERYTTEQKEGDVHILTLKDISIEDYGTIKSIARNLVGEDVSVAELTQKKLPCEVLEGLENATKGGEGEDVTLSVTIRGSPRPEFIWTKDGDVVENSATFKLAFNKLNYCEATISLTIIEASSMQSGQYRLRFFNELNEAMAETALVVRPVRRKPKISNVPGDLNVCEMEPGMFKCKIKGYPKPDVKWLKDGRVVRPTDILNTGMTANGEYFLEFKNVTLEDAGRYTIVASNDEGTVQCQVNLNVNPSPSKPKFLQGLKPTKVIGGYPCRMEVQLGGFPIPKVTWMRNGKPVEIDGSHVKEIITDDGRVILQIDNATDADAGEYSAIASNDLGQNTSSATLSVLDHVRKDGQPDGAPKFSEALKGGCYDEGKTIRLPVSVRGGPVPDLKWFKDGKELKLGDRLFFTHDGDKAYLEISPCVGGDTGVYKCVLENSRGKQESECQVTVRKCFEAPSFTHKYLNQQQLPGLDAKFSVKVDGVPKPEISWVYNNQPLKPDGEKYRVRKDADGCTLFVKETTYSDSGIYKVIAKNKEGAAEHEASLIVADDIDPNQKSEAPNILKAIGDQELYEGYTAKFKAVVSGRPEPEFEWYKNGTKLFPNNRMLIQRDEDGLIRLTLKHVCQEDAALYELRVWNEHGKASCKGKLICECISKVKKRPVGDEYKGFDRVRQSGVPIPLSDKPIISALSDRRCTLSWYPQVSAGVNPPVTYQVEMCECPEGDWVATRSGIRGCSLDISSLAPKSDYKFRVRVENRHGVSEPSPFVNTYRNRLERDPISHEPYLDMEIDDSPADGPFVPSGFRLNRDPAGNFYAAPRFIKLDHDTQYGMKNFSARIKWISYAYPTPKLRFYFKDEEIHFTKGGKYTYTQEAEGEIYLFIDKITERDAGWYKCEAFNEYGESHQRIRLGLSEYPRVVQHLQETYIRGQASGRVYCRIAAYPPCDVTWFKDWHEIKPSMKMRPQFIEPDIYCLNFNGMAVKDSGLYSLAAVNVAGAASSSCMVNVEDEELAYNWYGYGRGRHVGVNTRRGTLEDHYNIGDELGRGTQGVVYHVSERHSGRNFAGKTMWGKDQLKEWMHLEYDMMNLVNSCKRIVRLYDAYEGPKNMVLLMELCAGGELLHHVTQQQHLTEYEIARYVRQILEGLDYMHDRWIAHLGLDIGDLMVTHPNGTDIKIGDLSLARNIRLNKLQPLDYGMPEFVAPEVIKGESVTYPADMWSVGVITYILLSGTSPFRGEHDRETLTRIQKGELRFDVEAFSNLSDEAKDFIAKLLQFNPEHRLDVKSALVHPWIAFADMTPVNPYKINTDRLRIYYSKYKEWYANASCRRWFRRRTLASAFSHPSKMVYPPGEIYTPPESPEREIVPAKPQDFTIPHRDLSYEIDLITNDSRYQQGPDTYLLQLRDTDFPVRLRKYMNLARERSPIAMFTGRDTTYDYERIPVVHERRRFTDIMDEEIADERRRTMVDKYTAGFVRSKQSTCSLDLPKRVKDEVSSRYMIREEAEAIKQEAKGEGKAPFLREKPPTTAITPNMNITLSCVVTGDPEPLVQWFRNDIILGDTARMVLSTVGSRSQLTISECRDSDVGFYKVVARSSIGQVTHRFRLVRGEIPGMCDPPELQQVSGAQILLKWRTPIDDGAAPIEFYHLQIKAGGEVDWTTVKDCITQEVYLVEGLSPNKPYQFRVAARNLRGWGEFSVSTPAIRTSVSDSSIPKPVEQHLQETQKIPVLQLPGARGEIRDLLDYGREVQHVPIKTGDGAMLQMRKYKMVNEISRGRFSNVMRCLRQDDRRTFTCKILLKKDREAQVTREYEVAKSLRHERLATMYEAYQLPDVTAFIIEYLGGTNILTFLATKLQYTEQNVSVIINQVLDGVSYLHWRGLCHLDIQPENVILTSPNKLDIKLVDFGTTQKVDRTGSAVEVGGLLDYIAPEVLFEHTALPNSDVWSVGVLTYVLLTGTSPFAGGVDGGDEETMENIQCVRFKFETLGDLVSQEATRFIMLIFKRDPSKRPTEDECKDHKWLGENDFMVRKRERTVLSTQRLNEYTTKYDRMRENQASNSRLFATFMDQC